MGDIVHSFSTPGTYYVVAPFGTYFAVFKVWGAGGDGGTMSSLGAASGGGGGGCAYKEMSEAILGGTLYRIIVGSHTIDGGDPDSGISSIEKAVPFIDNFSFDFLIKATGGTAGKSDISKGLGGSGEYGSSNYVGGDGSVGNLDPLYGGGGGGGADIENDGAKADGETGGWGMLATGGNGASPDVYAMGTQSPGGGGGGGVMYENELFQTVMEYAVGEIGGNGAAEISFTFAGNIVTNIISSF